jgi:CheY-like chemotaxis protein
MRPSILLGIPDLLLSSKVNAAARAADVPTLATFTPHDLLSKAHGEAADLLLIDLAAEQLDPLASIRSLRTDEHLRGLRIVGILPHASAAQEEEARSAGCDLVLSRTRFFEALPTLLTGIFL